MKQKFSFNESGVQELMDMLYSLPTADFMESLQLLQIDFAAWVEHYFDLTSKQVTYMNDELTSVFKGQCQSLLLLSLSQRLAVRLEKDERNKPKSGGDGDPDDGVGKMIGIDLNPENQGKGSIVRGGIPYTELVFRIWYEDRT